MDLSDMNVVMSSLLIGAVGMGLFIYGKKCHEVKSLLIGLAMCIYPIFIHSLLLMWAIAGLCMLGQFMLPRAE